MYMYMSSWMLCHMSILFHKELLCCTVFYMHRDCTSVIVPVQPASTAAVRGPSNSAPGIAPAPRSRQGAFTY